MGQHLCYAAQSAEPVPPMPERVSAWAIYEPFQTADSRQIFVGVTTDKHWQRFCQVIARPDLAENPAFATNNQRIEQRPLLVAELRRYFSGLTLAQETKIQSEEQRLG